MLVTGTQTIAKNIKSFGGGFLKHVNTTMGKVSRVMDAQVTLRSSLRDHSLSDLRRLGHPYTSEVKASGLHTPKWSVHTQSGKLLSSKKSGVEEASISAGVLKASAYVMFDESIAPHALHIVYGTSKMIPRPVLRESGREVADVAYALLKDNLRGLVFNFKGE